MESLLTFSTISYTKCKVFCVFLPIASRRLMMYCRYVWCTNLCIVVHVHQHTSAVTWGGGSITLIYFTPLTADGVYPAWAAQLWQRSEGLCDNNWHITLFSFAQYRKRGFPQNNDPITPRVRRSKGDLHIRVYRVRWKLLHLWPQPYPGLAW